MVLYRSVAPWRRLLTLCESGILLSETGEILEQAAAACLSNNSFSVCHWEFRKGCSNSGKSLRYLKVILNKEG